MERISELPDELLIRILSFLPVEEIARAKLVSKPWKTLSEFSFVPPLTFEQPRHCNGTISSFHDSIDSSLKLHYQKGLSLSRIRLCLDLDLDLIGSSRSKIDSWIDAALERKVGQLDLCFLRNSIINYYPLPDKVFAAGTITVLRLQGFRLEIPGNIDLPALRKLCLRQILCEDQSIQKLISSCPLIQDLEIWSCSGKQGLHVSGLLNLQRLSVVCCYALQIIEIDAPTLQYLEFHHGSLRCDLVLTCSEFLRELILHDRFITEESFQNLLSTLPNLERLEINGIQLKIIEISHRQLKRLDLTLTNIVRILKIDTPNLQSLTYSGHRMPLISIISSLNASSLHELHLSFANHNVCSHFSILQLKEFFGKIRHHKDMKLHLHIKSKQELIIPTKLRPILSPPVYNIKHLSLAVYECCRFQYIIDRMLWMCHPQILTISRATDYRFLKVLYNTFMNKEKHPKCCTSCHTKCWRHYLEEIQIDGGESKVEIERIIEMPESSKTFIKCEVRFRLKWRS